MCIAISIFLGHGISAATNCVEVTVSYSAALIMLNYIFSQSKMIYKNLLTVPIKRNITKILCTKS